MLCCIFHSQILFFYFSNGRSHIPLFITPEALDHLKQTLKIPDQVKTIQLNPDNIETPAELDNYLDIYDACISEFLIQKRREERSCAASAVNDNDNGTNLNLNSNDLDQDEFLYIDSEEEDLANDLLTEDRKKIKKKYKNFISTMKETDERLAKSLACCEDLNDLEEKFKLAMRAFLETYDEMDEDQWEEKTRKTTRGKSMKSSDEKDENENETLEEEKSDQNIIADLANSDIDNDSIFEAINKTNQRNYTTSDFDIFIKNCLKMSNYQVNVVDGRGGVRLVPKKLKNLEDQRSIGSPGQNAGQNANASTPIFSEQLKEIFKIYNDQIYTSINDILTVYPEALEVMDKEIQTVKEQLDKDVVYSKSIATGKTDRKAYEIYFAVKTTLENVVKEKDHFLKVLEYIKKREQKIQVALLMNQI